jgi:hypothetical protein
MKNENEDENEDKKITAAKLKLHSRYFFGTSGRNRTGTPESTGF